MTQEINEKNTAGNEKEEQGYELKKLNLDNLTKHDLHPREKTDEIESLEESIEKDGLQEPLLVNAVAEDSFEVLDGMRRLEVLRKLKFEEADCLVKTGLDAEKAGRVSFIKNVERQSLSPMEIARHLKKLKDTFGFSHSDLELRGYGSTGSISHAISLLKLSKKVQDYIDCGDLTPTHGLALGQLESKDVQAKMAAKFIAENLSVSKAEKRVADFLHKEKMAEEGKKFEPPKAEIPNVYFKDASDMSELADKSVHLVVTSPPKGTRKDLDKGLTLQELLNNNYAVIEESCRVLVPGGIMALNLSDVREHRNKKKIREVVLAVSGYQKVLRKHGVYLSDIIVWDKKRIGSQRHRIDNEDTKPTAYRIIDNIEMVYVFQKEGARQNPNDNIIECSKLEKAVRADCVAGVWSIGSPNKPEHHPDQWPEELPERLIRMYSFVGDTVLDPFLGSGTTIKVSKQLNRNAVGYEIDTQYKAAIMKMLGVKETKEAQESAPVAPAANEQEKAEPKAEFFSNDPDLIKRAFQLSSNENKTDEPLTEQP